MNTDENQETPGSLRISAIPTVLVFQNGKVVDSLVGVNPKPNSRRPWTNSAFPEPARVAVASADATIVRV